MIRSIHTLNTNMNILQKRLENTSANIANVNTPGYKFQDIVQSTLESNEIFNHTGGPNGDRRVILGDFIYGNEIDEVYKNFEQGILYETNMETDFAIIGNGFFTVQMGNGELAYTRNGNFIVNDENQLTTLEGHLVIGGENKGNISEPGSSILITDFDDYSNLVSIGDTLFTSDIQGTELYTAEVRQGVLELSNVQALDEMIKLIQVSREFEANQKALHTADETLSKAVNEIGRV